MDVYTTIQRLQASNILDKFYAKSVILQIELSSVEIWNNYGKVKFAFNNFQIILKKKSQQQKMSARPKRQSTLTYMFLKALVLSKCQFHCSLFSLNK